ncbi:MerR family transcriptional regulator [Paenibacillus arenosi]|uniref:MerR family transcriptional regulator n=1 Tax=Paenibacillus arenosi TaxID=2774142 RepID=A0ABR9AWI6_9BACL|nr:MerR family transcriptional regulator [Paenibacillus arenosi]MBD8498453.1 MerR family transcriptional regulator [Paenibacillus arenosi]
MYPIGKFSELCHVPIKTIRYYSDIGLLKPSYIDPVTNYRYYDYDSIQTLNKITILKSCQLSLAEIQQMITNADPSQWMSILSQQLDRLEEQKQQINYRIEEIHQLKIKIQQEHAFIPGPTLSTCYLENREEQAVYTIRKKIKMTFIDHLVKQLFERIYAFQLETAGKLMAIFHEREDNKKEADVELLIPVKPMKDSYKLDDFKIRARGTYACITVEGPYSELESGYIMLLTYIDEQNLIQTGPPMEIYEQGLLPATIEAQDAKDIKPDVTRHPSEFITKIVIPVITEDLNELHI